ncbi:DUF6207 family protein [Streptomyces deserti]
MRSISEAHMARPGLAVVEVAALPLLDSCAGRPRAGVGGVGSEQSSGPATVLRWRPAAACALTRSGEGAVNGGEKLLEAAQGRLGESGEEAVPLAK